MEQTSSRVGFSPTVDQRLSRHTVIAGLALIRLERASFSWEHRPTKPLSIPTVLFPQIAS